MSSIDNLLQALGLVSLDNKHLCSKGAPRTSESESAQRNNISEHRGLAANTELIPVGSLLNGIMKMGT